MADSEVVLTLSFVQIAFQIGRIQAVRSKPSINAVFIQRPQQTISLREETK